MRYNPLSESRRNFMRQLILNEMLRNFPKQRRLPEDAVLENVVELPVPEAKPLAIERWRVTRLGWDRAGDSQIPRTRTYFKGGPTGPHSVYDNQDVEEHWNGYIDNARTTLANIETELDFLDAADPSHSGSYANWLHRMLRTRALYLEDVETTNELLT